MTTHAEIYSFGYLHGPPPAATSTVDLRECLYDPHVDPALRELTGLDHRVQHAVLDTPGARNLIAHQAMVASGLLQLHIPVVLAAGCAGGRHRSVVVATEIAARLRLEGWPVQVHHRDIDRPVVRRQMGP